MFIDGKKLSIIVFFIALCAIGIGYIIGYFTTPQSGGDSKSHRSNGAHDPLLEGSSAPKKEIFDEISIVRIRDIFKLLTKVPRLAGTQGDKNSAEYIEDFWRSEHLDSVQKLDYDILLSYPDELKFNSIEIKNDTLTRRYEIKEKTYDEQLDYSDVVKPYLGFAKNGSVTSDRVYFVNYCNNDDFDKLAKKNISVKGAIVICRFGFGYRGNKVKAGQDNGAAAVLIYDDPKRSAPLFARNKIYPKGDLLPPDGTQRGSTYWSEGDPLTPLYPATDFAHRINESDNEGLPKIVAQVIGYGLAEEILALMDDSQPAPPEWKGDLNASYAFGGKLKNKNSLTVNVYNQRRIGKVYNVIGVIRGSVEPDRYVIIGNHRDCWTFGAVDPTIGTSTMLEISRVLMDMKRRGLFKPRRSIVFMSFSGEEFGKLGSTELVEEFQKKLSANAVAYLNLDIAVYGNYSYEGKSSPLLFDTLHSVTKRVYVDEYTTVFERWLENDPDESMEAPRINPHLGSNSDHMAFLQRAGVPCIDQKFVRRKKNNPVYAELVGTYAAYHTSFDTYNLFTSFIDPGFKATRIVAAVVAETAYTLSSSLVLPFNTMAYSGELQKELTKLKVKYGEKLASWNINLSRLELAISNFTLVAKNFQSRLESLDKSKYNLIRQYNDQLRALERAFLDYEGLKRNGYLHTIFSPSAYDKYGGNAFPALLDSILDHQRLNTTQTLESVKFAVALVTHAIQAGSSVLREPDDFQRYQPDF